MAQMTSLPVTENFVLSELDTLGWPRLMPTLQLGSQRSLQTRDRQTY